MDLEDFMAHVHATASTRKLLHIGADGQEFWAKQEGNAFLRLAVWLRDIPQCEACREGKPCTMNKPCGKPSRRDMKEFVHWAGKLGIGISPISEEELIFQIYGEIERLERLLSFPWIRDWKCIMSDVGIPVFAAGNFVKS